MSVGSHQDVPLPDDELLALVTPERRAEIESRDIEVNRTFDVPFLANRSITGDTLYLDRDMPLTMTCGDVTFDPALTLAQHEFSEWYFMHTVGLDYEDAHAIATYCFEKPLVEQMGMDWNGYQAEFDSLIAANDQKRSNLEIPPNVDTAVFYEEGLDLVALRGDGPGSFDGTAEYTYPEMEEADEEDEVAEQDDVGKDATVSDVHQPSSSVPGKGRRKRRPIIPAINYAKADFRLAITITKAIPEEQKIFGWASVSSVNGQMVIDKQGDIVPIEEMEKGAHEFALYARDMGDMHVEVGVGKLIESWIFSKERAETMGTYAKNEAGQTIEGWAVGFLVQSPQVWADIKDGTRPELSIGGRARPVEVQAP